MYESGLERTTETRLLPASDHPGAGDGLLSPLLSVERLEVQFRAKHGAVRAVNGVTFQVSSGEMLGLVGESGSGKSVTSLAIMRLFPRDGSVISMGRVWFDGQDILSIPEPAMRRLRGRDMAIVFQNPMTSLNPTMRVGLQIAEILMVHEGLGRKQAFERSEALLQMVGVPAVHENLSKYAHEFSGGMQQRITIAMALALQPKLLIADEPTTALDVTIQAQVLDLIRERAAETGMAVVLITHNLGVAAGLTQRIAVMYAGLLVEVGETRAIFASPRHPYTVGLLGSLPRADYHRVKLTPIPGMPPVQVEEPKGCPFAPRCARQISVCSTETPALRSMGRQVAKPSRAVPGTCSHLAACHNPVPPEETPLMPLGSRRD
jgi:oligopeptide/dipeptide ABC transporter ATP-binding protein